jgi:hypothetical protein
MKPTPKKGNVFGTKKKLTPKAKKKIAPLESYWEKRLKKAKVSDNGSIWISGFITGSFLVLIISFAIFESIIKSR